MYPSILLDVVEYLNSIAISVSGNHEDGRVNSITDEDTIIDILVEKYGDNIEVPKARDWWDVKVFGYPLNIKSSKFGSAADNFSSKAAILYALTDLPEDKVKVSSWKKFQQALANNSSDDNQRDYYIFALNKTTNEVHLSSLKTLSKINPNGSNLPFQIKWSDNTNPVSRTHRQAYEFLVECYKESVRRKINAHDGFETL
jgi:hypothetical protein